MQIEDRVVRRHIVKLVTQIGASGPSSKRFRQAEAAAQARPAGQTTAEVIPIG